MFKNPFSFNGRIARTEYGISLLMYAGACCIIGFPSAMLGENAGSALFFLLLIPVVWFIWAQGAKRSHDIGNSGWFLLIPFYSLYIIFAEGRSGENEYGEDPKDNQQQA